MAVIAAAELSFDERLEQFGAGATHRRAVAANLRRYREAAGLSQERLSLMLDLDQRQVNRWESSRKGALSAVHLEQLTDRAWLVDGELVTSGRPHGPLRLRAAGIPALLVRVGKGHLALASLATALDERGSCRRAAGGACLFVEGAVMPHSSFSSGAGAVPRALRAPAPVRVRQAGCLV